MHSNISGARTHRYRGQVVFLLPTARGCSCFQTHLQTWRPCLGNDLSLGGSQLGSDAGGNAGSHWQGPRQAFEACNDANAIRQVALFESTPVAGAKLEYLTARERAGVEVEPETSPVKMDRNILPAYLTGAVFTTFPKRAYRSSTAQACAQGLAFKM